MVTGSLCRLQVGFSLRSILPRFRLRVGFPAGGYRLPLPTSSRIFTRKHFATVLTSSRFSGRWLPAPFADFKSDFYPEAFCHSSGLEVDFLPGSVFPWFRHQVGLSGRRLPVPFADLKSDFHPEAFCHGSDSESVFRGCRFPFADFKSDFHPEAFCHGSDSESVFRPEVAGSPLPTSSRFFIRKRFAMVPTSSRFSGREVAGSLIDFKSDFHPEAFCHGSDFSRFSALRLSVPLCRLQVGFLSGSILPRFRLEVGFLPGSVLPWFRH